MRVELLQNSAITGKLSGYWRVNILDEIPSTQSEIKKQSPENWDLLATEFQSSGRGRLDRTFEAAPQSALTFSIYIEPKAEKAEWSFLTLLAGLSVHEALQALDSQLELGLKWPNDSFIGGKKCGGMIAQATKKGVVIGIGINVGMTSEELPVKDATSLALEGCAILDRNTILASIINHFEINCEMWEHDQSFLAQYRAASVTLGREVEVTLPGGGVLQSRAVDISHAGGLLLDNGREITVGDVVHLR